MHKLITLPIVTMCLFSCSPVVKVQAPDKPIEINLNVNIEQRVRIEIQKEVQDAIAKNPDIF